MAKLPTKKLAYLERHRPMLLDWADDPGTFLVKTVRTYTKSASFDIGHFYRTWREIFQRHGIYNPYTHKRAIEGLLPHGAHSVRNVLATHVLKQFGSYDLANYAIQDTPSMVAEYYGRFLRHDKSAQAANILNRTWMTAEDAGQILPILELIRTPTSPLSRTFLDKD